MFYGKEARIYRVGEVIGSPMEGDILVVEENMLSTTGVDATQRNFLVYRGTWQNLHLKPEVQDLLMQILTRVPQGDFKPDPDRARVKEKLLAFGL